jgi:hypothetical protein
MAKDQTRIIDAGTLKADADALAALIAISGYKPANCGFTAAELGEGRTRAGCARRAASARRTAFRLVDTRADRSGAGRFAGTVAGSVAAALLPSF